MTKKTISLCVVFVAILHVAGAMHSAAGETLGTESTGDPTPPDFAREILPVLSNKCFVCHGPDADEKLIKLTSYEEATKERDGVTPIHSEDSAQSEILSRLHDEQKPMPPRDAEKQLTADERSLLTRWVESGGRYTEHWAYVPPKNATTHRGIDDFIGAPLEARKVAFAEEADKATLARRVALVLTGLPPEPEVLERHMSNLGHNAYETLVDRLLASPRYGEHQARYWLDAVRYGDTHGLHLDNKRGIYPYRDWVIQALNENLPLDDFITWQIAGDLLPNSTLEQQVATGYVRLNPSTGEGGAISTEFQAKNNFDRVETLGTAFLGMSLLCVRCHTHKYDPVPHEEYYRLMAFFNSTAESALDGNRYTYEPYVKAPSDIAKWKEWRALKDKVEEGYGADYAAPEKVLTPLEFNEIKNTLETSHGVLDDQSVQFKDTGFSYRLECNSFQGKLEGFQLEVISDASPSGDDSDQSELSSMVLSQFKATLTVPDGESRDLVFRTATATSSKEGFPVADIIRAKPAKGWGVPSEDAGRHRALLVLKREETIPKGAILSFELVHQSPEHRIGRFKISAADNVIDRGPHGQLVMLEDDFTTTLVAKEGKPRETYVLERGEYNMPTGDPLSPGVVSVAGPMPEGAPQNRLGLAQWLTSPDHPLVARVLVNRVWQRTFGYGLVRTPEDFGLQGEQPTHPELLDWLALDLHESDWSLKAMLKSMVMSRTFRQSSRYRAELNDPENRLFARGPSFRLDAEVLRDLSLWASGLLDPHMGGEGVKPYQPGGLWKALAHPASNTKSYEPDRGSKLYRRSLYVYWKRTAPHPMMTLFDAPNRETSCVRRSRSNTPLQSLALFNETQRIEASRMLAERLLKEAGADSDRIDLLFTLLISQEPSAIEREACGDLLNAMRDRYQASPTDAQSLLATGNIPRDESLDVSEHAAWTQVVTMLLASDRALILY